MIKAEIYYYPKYFGHIAVKVINPQTRQEIFYDFGGLHDLQDNIAAYYGSPIIIKLPTMTTDWDAFLENVDRSVYTTAALSKSFAYMDKPTYHFITNNCAHATQHFMYLAGYITKPNYSVGLRPQFVAKQAQALVMANYQEVRQKHLSKHLDSISHQEFSLNQYKLLNNIQIKILLRSLINDITILAYYEQSPSYLARDKLILEKINYDGSAESIERLFAATETLSHQNAVKLQQCILLLPPQSYLHLSIARLEKKAIHLSNRNHETAAACALALVKNLSIIVKDFEEGLSTYEQFSDLSFNAIAAATPELEQHRGVGIIMGNIALAIVGLGVFYLAAATLKKVYTGSFLFFHKTATANLVEDIGKEILNPRLVNKSSFVVGR